VRRSSYRVAVIAGDGIGREVVPEGVRVLDAAARRFGFAFAWEPFPWGCAYYRETGRMMPADGLATLAAFDAIFLGAEGEYSEIGGRLHAGTEDEMAMQTAVFTRRGTDRILRFAFDLARQRPKRHLTSATKSNGIVHTMPFWDERVVAVAADYPDVRVDKFHIDILAAHFVRNPHWFDVVVGSNLFGDILSDLGPAVAGSIAIAPSANLNPERDFPSMFEPVHGSAPDIAGKGIANPVGQIWAGAMMLEHLGQPEAAAAVLAATDATLKRPALLTPDLGGPADTKTLGAAIAAALADARVDA
jgi:tartrate dehydrogenase/decarboxylase/D-malate dehydrogenase